MKLMDAIPAIVLRSHGAYIHNLLSASTYRQPQSLLEAGRIDSATEYWNLFRLIVPIINRRSPAMAILNSMNAWNNYLWPLLCVIQFFG